jgi:hypothetical protein
MTNRRSIAIDWQSFRGESSYSQETRRDRTAELCASRPGRKDPQPKRFKSTKMEVVDADSPFEQLRIARPDSGTE